ncbi:MAG TPA: hypothetical protein VJ767_06610 [Nitrososphaeraceae archaeon]|nr:hypothetical protein [Nitrososphaeraceae archaeon]
MTLLGYIPDPVPTVVAEDLFFINSSLLLITSLYLEEPSSKQIISRIPPLRPNPSGTGLPFRLHPLKYTTEHHTVSKLPLSDRAVTQRNFRFLV